LHDLLKHSPQINFASERATHIQMHMHKVSHKNTVTAYIDVTSNGTSRCGPMPTISPQFI